MMEKELFTYLSSFGAIGVICAILFTNMMKEKKEDRDMYKQSMGKFIELSTEQQKTNALFANSIQGLIRDVTDVKEDVSTIKYTIEDIQEDLKIDLRKDE